MLRKAIPYMAPAPCRSWSSGESAGRCGSSEIPDFRSEIFFAAEAAAEGAGSEAGFLPEGVAEVALVVKTAGGGDLRQRQVGFREQPPGFAQPFAPEAIRKGEAGFLLEQVDETRFAQV